MTVSYQGIAFLNNDNIIIKVSMGVRWCSTKIDECQAWNMFIKDAQIQYLHCDQKQASHSGLSGISNYYIS